MLIATLRAAAGCAALFTLHCSSQPESPSASTSEIESEPSASGCEPSAPSVSVPPETNTETPSEIPSEVPSEAPSEIPSEAPSEIPSEAPSEIPSETPDGPDAGAASNVPLEPCPKDAVIEALTPDAGVARYGTVFGPSLYEADDPSTYEPEPISVRVTLDGAPVSGCEVAWETTEGHGWVFAEQTVTDDDGTLTAYWTAGDRSTQTATASILADTEVRRAEFLGHAEPSPETRTNSIHFHSYTRDTYSEYEVSVTPIAGPEATYFETHGWIGAYAGIQFDGDSTQVLFSVWDTGGRSSELRDAGACNKTVNFGGEGTGTSCRLSLPPSEVGDVEGLPSDYMLQVGDTYMLNLTITFPDDCDGECTDYSVSFSDVTRGLGPISLGTQRYMEYAENDRNNIFIEDWWSQDGDDCISAGERSAFFHDMRAKIDGVWEPVLDGTFSPNFVPTNNEICSNYLARTEGTRLLLSSGGARYVGPPLFEHDIDLSF